MCRLALALAPVNQITRFQYVVVSRSAPASQIAGFRFVAGSRRGLLGCPLHIMEHFVMKHKHKGIGDHARF